MREALLPDDLNHLSGHLHTAFRNCKLGEFERAVRLSHGPHGDESTKPQDGLFIAAIRDQISCVEAALPEFLRFHLEYYNEKENVGSNTSAACSSALMDESESLKDGKPNENRIAIADNEESDNLISPVVDNPKEKRPRTLFGTIGVLNLFGHCHVLQRQPHRPQGLLFSCSVRFVLVYVIVGTWKAFFLMDAFLSCAVPFVFYSS
ncbi:hypothetical protein ACJRO7_015031 [Eucalyptus globulus]|uniref:Uncharacterized protein n=1 Tax=Eucalyptus globulus TaxID=34317 RepID=A0ABD3L2W4_EUCGL